MGEQLHLWVGGERPGGHLVPAGSYTWVLTRAPLPPALCCSGCPQARERGAESLPGISVEQEEISGQGGTEKGCLKNKCWGGSDGSLPSQRRAPRNMVWVILKSPGQTHTVSLHCLSPPDTRPCSIAGRLALRLASPTSQASRSPSYYNRSNKTSESIKNQGRSREL